MCIRDSIERTDQQLAKLAKLRSFFDEDEGIASILAGCGADVAQT